MKNQLIYVIALMIFCSITSQFSALKAQNPTVKWANRILGPYGHNSSFTTIVSDHSGNILISAISGEKTEYNSQVFQAAAGTSFLAKFTAAGELIWYKSFAGRLIPSILIDQKDGIIVAGDTASFDDDNDPTTPANSYANYLARYNSDGSIDWIRTGYPSSTSIISSGMCLDSSGYVIFYGAFRNNLRLGSMEFSAENNITQGFLAKYNDQSIVVWSKILGNTPTSKINDQFGNRSPVSVDPLGNIYIGGAFSGTCIFDDTTLVGNSGSIFLARFNSQGALNWVTTSKSQYGGIRSINITPDNQLAMCGASTINTIFNAKRPNATTGFYGAILDTNGSVIRIRAATDGGIANNIIVDRDHNMYLSIDGGDGIVIDEVLYRIPGTADASETYFVKFDRNDQLSWLVRVGTPSGDESNAQFTISPTGSLIIAGESNSDTLTIGNTALINKTSMLYIASFDSTATMSTVHSNQQIIKTTSPVVITGNSNVLFISTPSIGQVTYIIYDILGRVLSRDNTTSVNGSISISISMLNSGHYFVAIKNELSEENSLIQFVK